MIPSQPGNDDNDIEARLRGALHSGLDPVRSSVELTEPTIGRAHVIRRRRRTAATVAAAVAVVAVAAPITWSTLRKGGEAVPASSTTIASTTVPTSTLPSTPPPTSASEQPPASTTEPDPVPTWQNGRDAARVVDVSKVTTQAAAPGAVWADGAKLHRDGRTVTLPVTGSWDYAPLEQGRGIVVDRVGEDARVRLVDAGGRVLETIATVPERQWIDVVPDAAGRRAVIYIHEGAGDDAASDAHLRLIDSDGTTLLQKDNLLHNLSPVGFAGERFLITNAYTTKRTYLWEFGSNEITRYTDTGMATAVHEALERATVLTITDDDFMTGCVDLMDVSGPSARPNARSCGSLRPTGFSPDGRHVVGIDVYGDGLGPGDVRVLDTTTGDVVLKLIGGVFFEETFLPDGAVAAKVMMSTPDGPRTTIVRCTVDGECAMLAEPEPSPDDMPSARYRLFPSP